MSHEHRICWICQFGAGGHAVPWAKRHCTLPLPGTPRYPCVRCTAPFSLYVGGPVIASVSFMPVARAERYTVCCRRPLGPVPVCFCILFLGLLPDQPVGWALSACRSLSVPPP